MSPQEAILRIKKHIEIHSRKEKNFAVYITEALYKAIKALEKQIPKKPIKETAKLIDFQEFYCPCCKNKIISKMDGEWLAGRLQKYCDECGQALDWSELK